MTSRTTDLRHLAEKYPFVLTEGALVERLRHEFHVPLDSHVNHASVIYDPRAAPILASLYRGYIDCALEAGVPVLVMTPTRRANADTISRSPFHDRPLLRDAVRFLADIRREYTNPQDILIGGLVGCARDAYKPEQALSRDTARAFHSVQAAQLLEGGVDFLFAGIMPEVHEALGMAEALAETGTPYVISFMVARDGTLLDGTPIAEAIGMIDEAACPPPAFYTVNCVHPANLLSGLRKAFNRQSSLARLLGIQANASRLEPHRLDGSATLDRDDFGAIVDGMLELRRDFGFKVFGGCCGTDATFMRMLVKALERGTQPSGDAPAGRSA